MEKSAKPNRVKVENYGDLLATINDLELVSFEEDGGYQGEYLAVMKDKERLFYFVGGYGSCSGCDWLEDLGEWDETWTFKTVGYKEAVEYCGDLKPRYIVPINNPLKFVNKGEYMGWELA